MEFKMIKIEDLQVNILNPRYVAQESEIEEMNMIIENGKIEELMKNIAIHGTDPSENLLVTKDDDTFIVEEGNRRITAVKLLNNPNLVPKVINNRDSFIARVNKIKSDYNYQKITKIQCVIVEDEEKLKHFIILKHTGENNGAGRISWSKESKIRFDTDNIYRRYLLDLINSIVPEKTEKFNFTTIERILADPDMRKAFSIIIDKKEPSIRFETETGKNLFKYVIRGLSEKKYKVKNFHSKQNRLDFIEYLAEKEQIKSEQTTIGVPVSVNTEVPKEATETPPSVVLNEPEEKEQPVTVIPAPKGGLTVQRTRRQGEPKGRVYPFQAINYKGKNPGISSALYELHQIPEIYKFPLAVTTLFRTLIECTIQEYVAVTNLQLNIKDKKDIKDLSIAALLQTTTENNGNFKSLQKLNAVVSRIINEANSKRDQDELNMVTHGNYRLPSKVALIDIERRWFDAVAIMIGEINGHK